MPSMTPAENRPETEPHAFQIRLHPGRADPGRPNHRPVNPLERSTMILALEILASLVAYMLFCAFLGWLTYTIDNDEEQ